MRKARSGTSISISKPAAWRFKPGESVAVDGVCLTVESSRGPSFSCTLMPETLERTAAASLSPGSMVNLERPLSFGKPLGGHIVQGHVDGVGRVTRVSGGSRRELDVTLPAQLRRFVAGKGSVALNGVSLTVARKTRAGCAVALIPHTRANTNLGTCAAGSRVNVEVDVVARYLDALGKRG